MKPQVLQKPAGEMPAPEEALLQAGIRGHHTALLPDVPETETICFAALFEEQKRHRSVSC